MEKHAGSTLFIPYRFALFHIKIKAQRLLLQKQKAMPHGAWLSE